MRPFRDLPIARKTLTLGLVPAISALIVVILASLLSTYMTAWRNQNADVESQATVVADNAWPRDSLEIASKALARTGATVTQAASGKEALDHWRKGAFDVTICDLAMPGMDGYEVIRNIRRARAAGAPKSRAIALTALASDSDRQAVLEAGFDDHIIKPFDFHDLLRAVAKTA